MPKGLECQLTQIELIASENIVPVSAMAAQELGEKEMFLVYSGHRAPNVNIELIVSRRIHAGKLAGFHFSDIKSGDDALDSGTIEPYRLFLVLNELVDAEGKAGLDLAHRIDQSHNVTDRIDGLMIVGQHDLVE